MKRIAARQYVKRRRREAQIDLMAETPEPDGEAFDGGAGVASRLDLDEALQCLTMAERLCVSLCYGGGLSHAEAADALNAPLGTVKSHVKRGLDKLRARLSAGEDGAGSQLHG